MIVVHFLGRTFQRMKYGFVIDNRKCIGCHACTVACKTENHVPVGVNRTWVKYVEKGVYPNTRRVFQVTRCNHCEKPPCVTICPVTAMYQRKDGIVDFNSDRCIGCKACMQACPYDSIYMDPDDGTATKCHFCAHRTEVGLEPACVIVCPEHAIIAGDLSDPASEAGSTGGARTSARAQAGAGNSAQTLTTSMAMRVRSSPRRPATNRFTCGRNATRRCTVVGPFIRSIARCCKRMLWQPMTFPMRVPGDGKFRLIAGPSRSVRARLLFRRLPWCLEDCRAIVSAISRWRLSRFLFTALTTVLLVWDLDHKERFLRVVFTPQSNRGWRAERSF